jgi:hypothetical protein
LKNDSYMEIWISDTRINNFQFESGYSRKGINIKGRLIEHYILYNDFNILEQWEKSGSIGKKEVKKNLFILFTVTSGS